MVILTCTIDDGHISPRLIWVYITPVCIATSHFFFSINRLNRSFRTVFFSIHSSQRFLFTSWTWLMLSYSFIICNFRNAIDSSGTKYFPIRTASTFYFYILCNYNICQIIIIIILKHCVFLGEYIGLNNIHQYSLAFCWMSIQLLFFNTLTM